MAKHVLTQDSIDEAAKEAIAEADEELSGASADKAGNKGLAKWVGVACATFVLGLALGRFALGGGASVSSGDLAGKVALTEAELDTPVARFSYDGTTETVTARDVILLNGSLEASVAADGTYAMPSADAALTVARNRIIEREAARRGISVSDEDIAAYAEQTLGTSDLASIATSYGMDEESVREIMRSSCLMSQLRDDVVGVAGSTIPEAPADPEGDASEPTADYAAYIIGLAGDEWDEAAGTWAAPDGPYAIALSGYDITADGATYEAAQTAYYVAYQLYSETMSATSEQWSDFVNGLLANGSIELLTLVA